MLGDAGKSLGKTFAWRENASAPRRRDPSSGLRPLSHVVPSQSYEPTAPKRVGAALRASRYQKRSHARDIDADDAQRTDFALPRDQCDSNLVRSTSGSVRTQAVSPSIRTAKERPGGSSRSRVSIISCRAVLGTWIGSPNRGASSGVNDELTSG